MQGANVKICINGTIPSGAQQPVAGQGLKNSAHGQVEQCDNDKNDDDNDDDQDNDVAGQGLKNSTHGQVKVIYSLTMMIISL